ncbi:hypothetical protein HY571_02145 [Candidatus Micrarchaeota archaeon]|nr:hypothetical protein [Candidatus Micrarchaeota archaeon]
MIAFTTCRKPGRDTKTLAENLALLVNGPYVSRGRKSVDEVVYFFQRKGFSRICFVNEEETKPGELAFFEKTWIAALKISNVVYYGGIKRTTAQCAALDKAGQNICDLFSLQEGEAVMKTSGAGIVFEIDEKKVLELVLK